MGRKRSKEVRRVFKGQSHFSGKVVRLIRQKYSVEVGECFEPTLAAEHRASEYGIKLSATTVRRWMLKEGLWSRARKARLHRKRRERRAHFGVTGAGGRQFP